MKTHTFRNIFLSLVLSSLPAISMATELIKVYKSPTCGCCNKWISHLKQNGFKVESVNLQNMQQVKNQYNIPNNLRSCHTAIVGGYLVEGHVPAKEIKKLLKQKPQISGLAVPGMPMGSPGMEGFRQDKYQVIEFSPNRKNAVFANY